MIDKIVRQLLNHKKAGVSSLARDVLDAITRRGYRDGWRKDAFMARQLCKALEELAEASDLLINGSGSRLWQTYLRSAALQARIAFDDPGSWWEDYVIRGKHKFAVEVADVLIPLLCVAAELEKEGIDIEAIIRAKVNEDVKRGVR